MTCARSPRWAEPKGEGGVQWPITALLLALMLLPTAAGVFRSFPLERNVLGLGWQGVVRQTNPNYCGPAVIATLLLRSGQLTSDLEVAARARMEPGGVSLAEFDRLATEFGFPGQWFGSSERHRPELLPHPSVVHLSGSGGHFAIFEGSIDGFVQLADPARGRVLLPQAQFEREWSGRVFLFGNSPLAPSTT